MKRYRTASLLLGCSALGLSGVPAHAVDVTNVRLTNHSVYSGYDPSHQGKCGINLRVDGTFQQDGILGSGGFDYDDEFYIAVDDTNGNRVSNSFRSTPAFGTSWPTAALADLSNVDFPIEIYVEDRLLVNGTPATVRSGPSLTLDQSDLPDCASNQPPMAVPAVNWSYVYSGRPGVMLDATGSSDPDGHLPLSYQWSQSLGPTVTLSDPTSPTPQFTAPDVTSNTNLNFDLVVTDAQGKQSNQQATVAVVVTPDACTIYDQARLLDEFPILTGGLNSASTIRMNRSKVEASLTQWLADAQASNALVSGAILTATLRDLGDGATPNNPPGQAIQNVDLHTVSLTQNGFSVGNQNGAASTFWAGAPLRTDRWYRLRTNLRPVHNAGGMFDRCTDASITFRLPRTQGNRGPFSRTRPVEIWDGKTRTTTTIAIRNFTLAPTRRATPRGAVTGRIE